MGRWLLFCSASLLALACYGQHTTASYRPLGATPANAFATWDSLRSAIEAPTAEGRRPVLPGVTGRNLELLQDALARKYTRVTQSGSLPVAQRVLSVTTESSLPKLRGTMAEALFLDRHPEWRYVARPNAPQHDVYAPMPDGSRGLRTGQVKFHMGGDPSVYARDMLKDYRSASFLVPDDHVDSLREFLRTEAERRSASGDRAGAAARYRDMNRVKGIGATSAQVDSATRQAIAEARVVRAAPYVFLGVAATLLAAPTALDWLQGEIDGSEAAYRLTKRGSALLSAVATDQALKHWRGGVLRGTMRGNAIIACVVLIVDTSWQAYEYGGIDLALADPEFVIHLGGSMSATACGLAGGYVGMIGGGKAGSAIGVLFGPLGVLVGTLTGSIVGGVAVGSAAGMAGYLGGAEATRWVMETLCSERLYEQEQAYIQEVRNAIEERLNTLQAMN